MQRDIGQAWKSMSQALRDSYLTDEELVGDEDTGRNADGIGRTLST